MTKRDLPTPIDDRTATSMVAVPRRNTKMLSNQHCGVNRATIQATALRVATANAPSCVAGLVEGITIAYDPRLAWHVGNLHCGAPLYASMSL